MALRNVVGSSSLVGSSGARTGAAIATTGLAAQKSLTVTSIAKMPRLTTNPAAKYRGRNAIVITSGDTRQIGATTYFTIRLLSER